MPKTVSIGNQDFESMIVNHCFYIDKSLFIKEWYESLDVVTLITRPRRCGKTLTMSMMNTFFSCRQKESKDLFKELKIADYPQIMELQGTFPVISISFAGIKEDTYEGFLLSISNVIRKLFREYSF